MAWLNVLLLLAAAAISAAASPPTRRPATARPVLGHWAFQPIRRPPVPRVRRRDRVRTPVDAFLLARLERAGAPPAPEAAPATLLRRVTLDLIGLPPTPEELDAFLADSRPDAYERVVDRLLASPHYGERWARPWLDLAHYADSDGYLTDQLRPYAWRYRQWVVDALNEDLPFDQFTLRQLAGDLLPRPSLEDRIATGFLRNTLSNREGGADLEEYRVEQVVDRTATVGAVWLGLTVGCARCHDHKYDRLSQKEFFQLYSFFDAADEVNVDAPLPGEAEPHRAARPEFLRRRGELTAPVRTELARLQERWEERLRAAAARPGVDPAWDRQWEVLGLVWGGNQGEGQLEGTQVVLTPVGKRTPDESQRLEEYFLKHGALVDPEAFRQLGLSELSRKLGELRTGLPKLSRAPVMRAARVPRTTRIHVRGDFRIAGAPVQPGVPACLPPLSRPEAGEITRLELARWLIAPDQPLTARVVVNRAWQELFGQGLVRTPEDFGQRGARPEHGELLDWLAAEFRTDWSQKRLHRLLVTSAAYRQSARTLAAVELRDPQNRLFGRQNPLRLPAESIRDAALAASGLLNRKVGGPSVFPPQPESVSKEGYENHWPVSSGPDRYRRGLYTWLQRLSPYAQNVTFDAPDLSRNCARRERSNTSLQALTLLNDPVFFEAAQALGARLCREAPTEGVSRIRHGYRLCLGREPQPAETARLLAYLARHRELLREDPSRVEKWCGPGVPEGERLERAVWTGAAGVLLNLHEFLTRD